MFGLLSRTFAAVLFVATVLQFAGRAIGGDLPEGRTLIVTVGDAKRDVLVFAPPTADRAAAPLIFAFHGHGATSAAAAKLFDFQHLWPEAIVVYMQGVPIASHTDPAGKKAGWQHAPGDAGDRDLKFFDATLARIRKDYKVDNARIYAAGQSNGGGFTYVLWAARGDLFAAFAPSSASNGLELLKSLKPRPAIHFAGEKDETVPFANQRKMMTALRQLNGCDAQGTQWDGKGMLFASKTGTPFIEVIHPGGHPLPDDAPPMIVKFFKDHARP